jgi:transcriptional regulator with XRE-family HTH domain
MTPQELRAWRGSLGWSQLQAAEALGLALRFYRYLEAGETSGGARPNIPRPIELATCELTRRELPVPCTAKAP